jgi:two-component system, NtrC family, response regulator AtoC
MPRKDEVKPTISVLAVLGDPSHFEGVVDWVRRRGQAIDIVRRGVDALRIHRDTGADLVLVGLPLPDRSSASLLGELKRQDPYVAIVVVGTDAHVASAGDAIELGAQIYFPDPVSRAKELVSALGIGHSARNGDTRPRLASNRAATNSDWSAAVGKSPAMAAVLATLRQVCQRTTMGVSPAVLLTGETGTGKGLIAKLFHNNSQRRQHAFVAVNCAAIPGQLLESELFGHEKGAFTDARSTRVGLFETANKGTLFLDEIGAMPLDLQSKILSAIEDKEIRRVGARAPMRVDVQIIAATHNDLGAMVKHGSFREDLFHRLNVIAIELPPLRERGEDVIEIAEALVATLAAEYGIVPPRLAADAREAIRRHAWPGNVRELRNELERIVLLADDDTIHATHFRLSSTRAIASSAAIHATPGGLEVVLSGDSCPLEDLEREVIRQALVRCNGNVSGASRYLAISRQTMIYRMKKHGLASPSSPGLYSFSDSEETDP